MKQNGAMLRVVLCSAAVVFILLSFGMVVLTWKKGDNDGKSVKAFQVVLNELLVMASASGLPGNVVVDDHGDPLYSWRFEQHLMLDPVTESTGLPVASGNRWNSSVQQQITNAGYGRYFRSGSSPYATIFAFEGDDSALLPIQWYNGSESEKRRKPNKLPRNLIIIVQVRQTKIQWNEPGDCLTSALEGAGDVTTIGNLDLFRGPVLVGFVDNTVWRLSASTPTRLLAKFATIEGAAMSARDTELGPYAIDRYKAGYAPGARIP